MTNAPERIWACMGGPMVGLFVSGGNNGGWPEYVRADIVQALTAERDARIDPAHVQTLINAAEPALAEALAAAEAERDRLRAALDGLLTLVEHANFEEGWCCCGDDMLHHQSPMDCGHTPVDMGEYHASLAIKEARAALKGETNE